LQQNSGCDNSALNNIHWSSLLPLSFLREVPHLRAFLLFADGNTLIILVINTRTKF